jgi:hypothetical protein
VTPLAQVIIANCEGLAFSRSVAVRATWAATFLRGHKRSSHRSALDVNADFRRRIAPSHLFGQSRWRAEHVGGELGSRGI